MTFRLGWDLTIVVSGEDEIFALLILSNSEALL
jgi:hypothetical protein